MYSSLNFSALFVQKINLSFPCFSYFFRMGALDVCPFIPVQDVTVEECVEISKKFGARMAEELGVAISV